MAKLNQLWSGILCALFSVATPYCKGSTILGDLPIRRALVIAQSHHRQAFSWCPFVRLTRRHEPGIATHDLFSGVGLDYRFRAQPYWLDVTTSLSYQSIRTLEVAQQKALPIKLESGQNLSFMDANMQMPSDPTFRSRFGLDDITVSLGYDFIDKDNNLFAVYGLVGIPTTAPDPAGVLVGTGHSTLAIGWDTICKLSAFKTDTTYWSLIANGILLHTFDRTVFLDKKQELIDASQCPCTGADFRQRFNLGSALIMLYALRYNWPHHGWEIGYNPVIAFGARSTITGLKPGLPASTTTESKTLVIHRAFGQGKFTIETSSYPLSIVAGASYALGNRLRLRRFVAWVAASLQF